MVLASSPCKDLPLPESQMDLQSTLRCVQTRLARDKGSGIMPAISKMKKKHQSCNECSADSAVQSMACTVIAVYADPLP